MTLFLAFRGRGLAPAFLARALLPLLAFFLAFGARAHGAHDHGGSAAHGAPVAVGKAWARASVPGQRATGAFMTLVAREPLTLVEVASPVAGVAEIHEMRMEGDVMRMRAVEGGLPLPAGRPVELRPGGHHLMLMELKAPLAAGTQVPLTLGFRDARGAIHRLDLQVPVTARPPAGGHGHGH